MKFVVVDPPFVRKSDWERVRSIPAITEFVQYDDPPSDQEDIIRRIYDADLMSADIYINFNKDILSEAKRLKAIFTQSVGFDNYDIEYLRKRDIKLYNCAGFNANAVGEYVFSLAVSLMRKIPAAQQHVKVGGWEYSPFQEAELAGKTMGIIGSGNVAQKVIRIAKGFNMNIIVFTKNPSTEKAKILDIDKFSTIEEVLKRSDILSISVPLTNETVGMIGKKELSLMKDTAILINTSRHTIINENDLADALIVRELGGAALDVILSEPFNSQVASTKIREMLNLPNVVVTPHIGGITTESLVALGDTLVMNVHNFLKGDLTNCVN